MSDKIDLLAAALQKIARWRGEFPSTGRTWADGSPMSYSACYGSIGERDYMRQVALDALAAADAQAAEPVAGDMPVAVWYRTERDISDEYFTNYSEGPDRPDGEGWKPLCDPQTVMAMVMAEQFKRAIAGPQSNENKEVAQTEQPSLSPKERGDICASCHTLADCSKVGECDHHGYPLSGTSQKERP